MALSALLWLLTAAAWCRKVAEVDPLPFDRYGRTVALVRVGDTVVKEELIRQGPASVFARCCDRAICQRWERLEDKAREVRRGL